MQKFYIFIAAMMLAITLTGCSNEGPAEEAGEKIDSTIEDMGNQLEDTCEEMKEKTGMKDQDC